MNIKGYIKITPESDGVRYEQKIEGDTLACPVFFGHAINQVVVGFYKALCESMPPEIAGGIIVLFLRTAINEAIKELGVDMEAAENMVEEFEEFKNEMGLEV